MPCALPIRSEEHTSELQSHDNLVCRLLLEKNRSKRRPATPGPGWRPWRSGRCFCARVRGGALERLIATPRPRNTDWSLGIQFFFFKLAATPEISPLSQPDALPI